MVKYCKYCKVEHQLTESFWYRLNSSPRCKVQVKQKVILRQSSLKQQEYRKYQKEYRSRRKDERLEQNKVWREINREYHRASSRKWYQDNKAKRNKQVSLRLKKDVMFRLRKNITNRLRVALQGKMKPETMKQSLGCTLLELKQHLEQQFTQEMTWENYGKVWQIDHILPLANYLLTDRGTYRRLSHYTNLQPLLKLDNQIKSNKEIN
jgi:hypothetical protein